MPLPAYRQPNVVQPQPRSQERVAQFPGALVDQIDPSVLRLWMNATGGLEPPQQMTPYGPVGGLLDRRAGVQAPLGAPGLLQPAMWDRVRRQMGLLGTEGGGRGMGGTSSGVGRGSVPSIPRAPQKLDWAYSENTGMSATTTKSGVRILVKPTHAKGAEFMFYEPGAGGGRGRYQGSTGATGKPSTERGIRHFSEVISAMKDYKTKFSPTDIEFGAESEKHRKPYKRMAPMIAEVLGGTLKQLSPNHWRILFKD